MNKVDTEKLREKYMKYWGEEGNFETENDAFDEFGGIIDVDLANEIVEWSVLAADVIDKHNEVFEKIELLVRENFRIPKDIREEIQKLIIVDAEFAPKTKTN